MKEKVIKFENGEKVIQTVTNGDKVTILYEEGGFKRGDIIFDPWNSGMVLIFDEYITEERRYFKFVSRIYEGDLEINSMGSLESNARLATNEEANILHSALEKECKKWNADTLTLEDVFKDGDILYGENRDIYFVFIFKDYGDKGRINCHYYVDVELYHHNDGGWVYDMDIRHATDEEKVIIYTQMAKEGKYFDKQAKKLIQF